MSEELPVGREGRVDLESRAMGNLGAVSEFDLGRFAPDQPAPGKSE